MKLDAAGFALAFAFVAAPALADDTIKIGYIDPFSGPFAATGNNFLKVFTFILEKINAEGGPLGKKYELVTFDSKLQPAEALIALKGVTDQNLPFVFVQAAPNAFARRALTIGDRVGDHYEVKSGLKDGEQVIAEGGLFLEFAQSQ